jgi:hypothetical protein
VTPKTPLSTLKAIADTIAGLMVGEGQYDLELPERGAKEELIKANQKLREIGPKVLLAVEKFSDFFARRNDAHSRKGRTDQAKRARKIAGVAAALASEFNAGPDPLSDYLFGPERARHEVLSKDELDFLIGESLAHKSIFFKQLTRLRDDCERLKKPLRDGRV